MVLQIYSESAKSFGCKGSPIPPECQIKVIGDDCVEGYVKNLNYPVTLSGASIKDKEPIIVISRTMIQRGLP